jgi:hypothetical protein
MEEHKGKQERIDILTVIWDRRDEGERRLMVAG